DFHTSSAMPQSGDGQLSRWRVRARAPGEHEVPDSLVDQPFGQRKPEAAETARDQITGVTPEQRGSSLRRGGRWHCLFGVEDDLPDVPRLRHVTEGADRVGEWEDLHRKRFELTALDQANDLLQERVAERRLMLHQPAHVQRHERESVAERPETD